MDVSDLVTLGVAVLSLLAALSSQRASSRAAKEKNATDIESVNISSRTDLETEAYMRARALDVATIQRQDEEIEELNEKYDTLEGKYDALESKYEDTSKENRRLKREVDTLKRQVEELQRHEREGQ